MKNKHLVLLFLGVLAIGFVARKLPFWRGEWLDTGLIKADTAKINRILVDLPGQPELSLERSESGWFATQDGRTAAVPASVTDSMLGVLAQIRSLRIAKNTPAETSGLAAPAGIAVQIFEQDRPVDAFRLGRQVFENDLPATYLGLPGHEGVYLVKGHLLAVFSKKMSDFRQQSALRFYPWEVATIQLMEKNGAERLWQKNDSLQCWVTGDTLFNCPEETAQAWLRQLLRLNGRPFADSFDESLADSYQVAQIILAPKTSKTPPLVLRIFYAAPPELPEDMSGIRSKKIGLTPWVFHSSQNPDNYFALEDSTLAKVLCKGLAR